MLAVVPAVAALAAPWAPGDWGDASNGTPMPVVLPAPVNLAGLINLAGLVGLAVAGRARAAGGAGHTELANTRRRRGAERGYRGDH